ncbi:MAG: DNA mismatch repair protein MutS [Ignavibacteriae bacterium]|nr:DNA mismatch repair protein MutS [Ignavibacteria bacterium]MBI3365839.1 DNA mismatch repair protein MutS [Ignavibacteriota bacterium]
MRQYARMKAKYPDTVLLFRMGDFYETFEDDALIASKVLGITLTKRGNGTSGETPLAGFPYHALDSYMPKLLKAGYRVAVCEQLEDPKFAKGIVKRDVIEVVTPGVAFSDKVLEQKQNNYLLAVALPSALATAAESIGIAFSDVSTGEFGVSEFPLGQFAEQVAALQPSEILVQKRDRETIEQILKGKYKGIFSKLDDWVFNFDYAYELLINHFKTQTLKGFGVEGLRFGIIAAGAVMNYLQETQKANLLHIRKIVPYNVGDYITLDHSTKRNLEITRSIEGREDGTLFWVLDRTQTPMGARLLKKWINQPLRKIEPIRARLAAVRELVENADLRKRLTETLSSIGDIERLISKICTGRSNPRELVGLKNMLVQVAHVKSVLNGNDPHIAKKAASTTLVKLAEGIKALEPVVQKISTALSDDPPPSLADGGVIKKGFSKELDELRDIALNGKSWIANLQKTERESTGIASLKVGFNNVFGYYIEITNTHKDKVPDRYIRKQTLANAERFLTPELKEYEEKILHAEEKILSLEMQLFNELRMTVAEEAEAIQQNARLVAMLDCFVSLAHVAVENNYVEPAIDEGMTIEILQGRHPVIEKLLPPGEPYTANDVLLTNEENQVLIITGPNMSGKSSYLRQVGLIVLLAQIGSFVPAKKAHIGLVDRIYTRVGASDNIASGESTFLVEMHEAANIVNTATTKSLILLDEVGRGTSTFDGISIAWALTEYLHNRIGAKTLFATHYHELNELAELFPRIKNLKVEVREYGDKVLFLHKVTPGFADHSYGIQVAQMAGLPEEVTERAKNILKNLEGSELTLHDGEDAGSGIRDTSKKKGRIAPAEVQMTLFEMKDDKLREELKKLDVEKLTPIEALNKLADLKRKAEK